MFVDGLVRIFWTNLRAWCRLGASVVIDFYSIENWCPRETIKDYVDEIIFLLGNFRPVIFFFFKSRINCGSPEQNNTELKELTNKSSQNDNHTNVNEHLVVMTVI